MLAELSRGRIEIGLRDIWVVVVLSGPVDTE